MLLNIISIFILAILLFYIIYINKISCIESFATRYTAVIIEPREHKALEFVLENFLENLSDNWDFIIFHGNNNISYINNILDTKLYKYKDRIKLINLNVDNLSIRNYNNLLVSPEFYKSIPTEVFLIFQTDSMICKDSKDLINKFIKYDYTGAPLKCKLVGNGVLSLRRKSKMLEILEKCEYKNEPEDVYFSKACDGISVNKPDYEESKEFSVEAIYHPNSFGVHKPWLHLKKNELKDKNNYCKGVYELTKLNKI